MAVLDSQNGSVCNVTYENGTSSDDPTYLRVQCLSPGQRIGLMLVAEAGLASMLAVVYVFWIITCNAIRSFRLQEKTRQPLIAAPIDVLMLSLFVADFLHGMGAAFDFKWIGEGKVEVGSFCTAQGVIQQLGTTGGAIGTLIIAIYTFVGVWWEKGLGRRGILVAKVVVAVGWTFVALITLLGNLKVGIKDNHLFEIPTPYWCWINAHYSLLRLFGEYIWLWITLGMSTLIYLILYLLSRGIIIRRSEDPWWKFQLHKKGSPGGSPRGIPSMLAYPVVFSILVLPMSFMRWIKFSRVPAAAATAVDTIFCLNGVANVILLLKTRPNSTLFGKIDWNHWYHWDTNEYGLPDTPSIRSVTREIHHHQDSDGEIAQQGYGLGKLPSTGSAS
ncbi:hypothetical protein BDQ17DRAFT_1358973 [Cyathus striatus]|nr:hypothetical protein BDQ17DRAFT_1358973 [Cyathus striatus]